MVMIITIKMIIIMIMITKTITITITTTNILPLILISREGIHLNYEERNSICRNELHVMCMLLGYLHMECTLCNLGPVSI